MPRFETGQMRSGPASEAFTLVDVRAEGRYLIATVTSVDERRDPFNLLYGARELFVMRQSASESSAAAEAAVSDD